VTLILSRAVWILELYIYKLPTRNPALLFPLSLMASNSSGLLSEADALLLKSYATLTIQEVLGILFEGVFFGESIAWD
jgi:hypothetical protein